MSDEREKPGAGFWCTVLLVSASLAYPLGFGPACWIHARTGVGGKAINIAYRPIGNCLFPPDRDGGYGGTYYTFYYFSPTDSLARWYANLGTPQGVLLLEWGNDGPTWVSKNDRGLVFDLNPPARGISMRTTR
jgi:hypothetical protein